MKDDNVYGRSLEEVAAAADRRFAGKYRAKRDPVTGCPVFRVPDGDFSELYLVDAEDAVYNSGSASSSSLGEGKRLIMERVTTDLTYVYVYFDADGKLHVSLTKPPGAVRLPLED